MSELLLSWDIVSGNITDFVLDSTDIMRMESKVRQKDESKQRFYSKNLSNNHKPISSLETLNYVFQPPQPAGADKTLALSYQINFCLSLIIREHRNLKLNI